MPALLDGWTTTKGVSCAGWDIWIGFCPKMPEGSRFAMFRRRIADQETYDKGLTYPTSSEAEQGLACIKWALHCGKYSFDDLFPEEVLINHPNFGAF